MEIGDILFLKSKYQKSNYTIISTGIQNSDEDELSFPQQFL